MENNGLPEKSLISRRKMLSTLGIAGATLVAGDWLRSVPDVSAQSVTQDVYGDGKKKKKVMELHVLNVKDFGAEGSGSGDDTPAIQAALDQAQTLGGATVYVPDGVYPIHHILSIFANTKLELSHNAIIRRNSSAVAPMLMNGRKGQNTGYGYEGNGNIEIVGGTWDGNSANYPTPFPHMSFAHSKHLIIRDTNIINNVNDHHIEINSTDDCQILNVCFRGYMRTSREAEAIQIDLSSQGGFPHFGPWDNTPCNNIIIDGCSFVDCCRGVGSHSAFDGANHRNIRITNCHFENISDNAVYAWNYDDLIVANNTFQDCVSGIDVSSRAGKVNNIAITGNVLRRIRPKSDWGAIRVYTPLTVANAGGRIHNIAIIGNIVEDVSGSVGIHVNQVSRIAINHNIVRNVGTGTAGRGINIGNCEDGGTVQGNHVSQCNDRGIAVNNAQGPITLTGNVVATTGTHGIQTDTCQHISCTGNAISHVGKDGIGNGIYFLRTNNSQLSNNTITNCAENSINMKTSTDCSISGNILIGAALKLSDGNERHYVQGNQVRRGDKTFAFGIYVSASTSNVALIGNDLRQSGVSAAINDDGADTLKSGNITDSGIV